MFLSASAVNALERRRERLGSKGRTPAPLGDRIGMDYAAYASNAGVRPFSSCLR